MSEQRNFHFFGGFALDAQRRLLLSQVDDQVIPLPTTAFDALLHLVDNAGELVEKAALMRVVWPHVTVEENSLNQSISVLRRALGETPSEPRFIVTVPGRGYRFVAEVTRQDTPAVTIADPHAYQLYVTGWWALTRPGGGNLENALKQLEGAVALDPNFALAHACIADCYVMLSVHSRYRPHEVFPKARAAALRALEIDGNLAEAHAELAHIHAVYDFDYQRAQARLRHALEINPRCFLARRCQGIALLALGQGDAALDSFRRAQSIEPLAVHINGNIGMAHYFSGRYEEAVAQFELTLRMDRDFDVARAFLGWSLLRLGEVERARAHFEARPSNGRRDVDMAVLCALSGRTDEARTRLDILLHSAEQRYVPAYDLASIFAALEEDGPALDWLERGLEERVFNFLGVDPVFQRLHGQPRFDRLLRGYGLK